MAFSSFTVLGFMGGEIAVVLVREFGVSIDVVTFCVLLFNFTVVGVLSIFMSKMPILVTQSYLVVIGVLVAYWFTLLPEWTTWALLVALALYDLADVLLPGGPLRLLVELAMSRDADIPALVYEARPVTHDHTGRVVERRSWRARLGLNDLNLNNPLLLSSESPQNETRVVIVEDCPTGGGGDSELSVPLFERPTERSNEPWED